MLDDREREIQKAYDMCFCIEDKRAIEIEGEDKMEAFIGFRLQQQLVDNRKLSEGGFVFSCSGWSW